jgi:hypothetical protein
MSCRLTDGAKARTSASSNSGICVLYLGWYVAKESKFRFGADSHLFSLQPALLLRRLELMLITCDPPIRGMGTICSCNLQVVLRPSLSQAVVRPHLGPISVFVFVTLSFSGLLCTHYSWIRIYVGFQSWCNCHYSLSIPEMQTRSVPRYQINPERNAKPFYFARAGRTLTCVDTSQRQSDVRSTRFDAFEQPVPV